MIPLSDVTKGLLDKLRPKESDYAVRPSRVPIWPGFTQRRFLVKKGTDQGEHTKLTVVWIDDDGTCTKDFGPDFHKCHTLDDQGFIERKDWHSYRIVSEFRKENQFAFRCPASLSFDERNAIYFDIPPGHFEAIARSVRESLKNRKQENRKEPRDEAVPF